MWQPDFREHGKNKKSTLRQGAFLNQRDLHNSPTSTNPQHP